MRTNARSLPFVLRHGIEDASGARRIQKGHCPPAILDRRLGSVGFPGVVNQLYRRVRQIRDLAPALGHQVDRVVVIFRDPVRRNERVQDHHVQLEAADRLQHGFDVRGEDGRAGRTLLGNDNLVFTAAPQVKPFLQIVPAETVQDRRGKCAAFSFLKGILAVPVADAKPLARTDAQDRLTAGHRHSFGQDEGRLADTAGREGHAGVLADQVTSIDKIPPRHGRRVTPAEGAHKPADGAVLIVVRLAQTGPFVRIDRAEVG